MPRHNIREMEGVKQEGQLVPLLPTWMREVGAAASLTPHQRGRHCLS